MKNILTLFGLSLLLVGCSKTSSDADIRSKLVGTWTLPTSDTMTINSDGSLKIVHPDSTVDGTWSVDGGVLTDTITNLSGTSSLFRVGQVSRYEVVHIDEHDLTCRVTGQTNLLTAHKP